MSEAEVGFHSDTCSTVWLEDLLPLEAIATAAEVKERAHTGPGTRPTASADTSGTPSSSAMALPGLPNPATPW